MLTRLFFFTVALASARLIHAQSCSDKLTVHLQNAPNQMEPDRQPTRLRVDDRSSVSLCLVNLSPLDVCTLSGRTPTPTAETSALESITTTIAALGGFALGAIPQAQSRLSGVSSLVAGEYSALAAAKPRGSILDDPKYKLFLDTAHTVQIGAVVVLQRQESLQSDLTKAVRILADYIAADYRGSSWRRFHPENDSALDAVRQVIGAPVSGTAAWVPLDTAAELQTLVDQMAKWAADLDPTKFSDPDRLRTVNNIFADVKGAMAVITDNNTSLKTGQTALKTAYDNVVKVYVDFQRRLEQGVVTVQAGVLNEKFNIGTDRKATVTGVLSCVSDADPTKATTDTINYSLLYQDAPKLTASAGLLTTFLHKTVIGTTTVNAPAGSPGYAPSIQTTPPTPNCMMGCQIFAVTDSARAQVFPIAYLNYRVLPAKSVWHGRTGEDELVLTGSLSGGFGINPNTGTNQPEFFLGTAIGFGRLMIHPGAHYGRTESLGGNFLPNTVVPSGLTSPPLDWKYHWKFAIGFSVRVAPF